MRRKETLDREYVERECPRCLGGVVHVGSPTEVRTAFCPDCNGTGRILSYLYPKPKGRRGPWPPEEATTEGRRTDGARRHNTAAKTTETKGPP